MRKEYQDDLRVSEIEALALGFHRKPVSSLMLHSIRRWTVLHGKLHYLFGHGLPPEMTDPRPLILRAIELQGDVSLRELQTCVLVEPAARAQAIAALSREGRLFKHFVVRRRNGRGRRVVGFSPRRADGFHHLREATTAGMKLRRVSLLSRPSYAPRQS
jgi:hypothetical protein